MADNDEFSNLPPEEKLKAENELLKLKLETEFGMSKMESSLDDKTNNEWLNQIYNFEKAFAEHKQIRLYDFIGKPEFKKADDLNKELITLELNRIMEIFQKHNISLDTICYYEDEVIYRFITEEFFDYEMDDMRIPGMMHGFIYEEFRPNHDYDIRKNGNEFLELLISKKWDDYLNNILLADAISYNDQMYDRKTFPPIIEAFQTNNQKLKLINWEIQTVLFNLDTNLASLKGLIKYKSKSSGEQYKGPVLLEFFREYDFWSISKVVVPGFSN